LLEVLLSLPIRIDLQKRNLELSFAFSAAGVVLVMLALGLSVGWYSMP
jgi:hypothetical protein